MRKREEAEIAGQAVKSCAEIPADVRLAPSRACACSETSEHIPCIFTRFTTQDLGGNAAPIPNRFSTPLPMLSTDTAAVFGAQETELSDALNAGWLEVGFCKTGETLGNTRRFGKRLITFCMNRPLSPNRFFAAARLRVRSNAEQLQMGLCSSRTPRCFLEMEIVGYETQ